MVNSSMRRYKRSRQREHIYQLLKGTDSHPTAMWIYQQMKPEFQNLSMGTVYRNVNILVDQNKVRRIGWGSSYDRFDANTDVHYHFICRDCKSVYDLALEKNEALNNQASAASGFEVEEHRIDFYGICSSCKHGSGADGEKYHC